MIDEMEHNYALNQLALPCIDDNVTYLTKIVSHISMILNFFILFVAKYDFDKNS